ncbi:TonB-dependent receptor [Ferrimonas pelagia]|uniref:TonB-dependent receptor n=1 Tax=Ferrimonas pelagia TaxID=1177826 RepID=A0ABP9F3J6_9GAMM
MAMESSVSKAVRQGLLATTVGAVALAGTSVVAVAQANDDVERIEVTGSRISRTDMETASPVEVLDRDFIEKSGVSNIAELLRQVPANQSTQDVRQTNGFAGAATGVDLNGLGVGSTLTLLNGRRMALHGRPDGSTQMFVNIDSIPLAAVERVEVLRDGASAIYGSDAIAGVVNIILRKDYEGVELSSRYGHTTDGSDMGEWENSLFIGTANDKTSMNMMVSHYKRQEVWGSDLGLNADNGFIDFSSSAPPSGVAWVPGDGGFSATGDSCEVDYGNGKCYYDYVPTSTKLPEISRWGLMANMTHELTADHSLKLETMLSNTTTSYNMAAAPWFADNDAIYITNRDNPIYAQIADGNGFFDNGYAYDGSDLTFRKRFTEVGEREANEEATTYRVLVGLDGVLADEWYYSTGVMFNKSYTVNRGDNYVSTSRALEALNSGVDLNGDGVISDDEWLNPIAPVSDALADYLRATTFQESSFRTVTADFTLSNSELVEIWAGSVGMAVGLEWRQETLEDISSDNLKNGDLVGSGGSDAIGERELFSSYIEFAIPLMDNDFGYIETQLAARYEDYSDFGNKTTPKAALSYRPIEGLMLRASYAEGFRAPNLYELDGQRVAYTRVTDPLRCDPGNPDAPNTGKDCGQVQIRLISGGNSDLKPETSTSINAGVVVDFGQLGLIDNLSMTVDYFKLEHEDRIQTLSTTEILRLESEGTLPEGTAVIRGPAEGDYPGEILDIITYSANLSSREVKGYNMGINYLLGLGSIGEFDFTNSTYYLESYNVMGSEWAGTYLQPRLKNTTQLGWKLGDWSSSLTAVYRGRFDDYYGEYYYPGVKDHVASMTTLNLGVNYHGFENTTLTVGIDNLTNKSRPVDATNDSGGISDVDNLYGQFVYAQVKFNF